MSMKSMNEYLRKNGKQHYENIVANHDRMGKAQIITPVHATNNLPEIIKDDKRVTLVRS